MISNNRNDMGENEDDNISGLWDIIAKQDDSLIEDVVDDYNKYDRKSMSGPRVIDTNSVFTKSQD